MKLSRNLSANTKDRHEYSSVRIRLRYITQKYRGLYLDLIAYGCVLNILPRDNRTALEKLARYSIADKAA